MALSIRRRAVETKARALAARRGVTMTTAIEQALDDALAGDTAAQEADVERRLAAIHAIQARVAALGDTGLTEDEIMGWDENGLPT